MSLQRIFTGMIVIAMAGFSYAGADSTTQIFHNVVNVFPGDTNPCTGDTGTTTLTFSGVIHTSTAPNGNTVVHVTLDGNLDMVPDDSSRPTFDGHFVSDSTNTFSQKGETQTATFFTKLAGSDGTIERFQVVAHITLNGGGVAISFDKPRCF